jgi:ribonuclease P protein component
MKGLFTFSKEEKLTGKTNIDQLFNNGKSFPLFPFKVFYRLAEKSDEPSARLLIAIPKKKVKHAVDRNRLRRLIREAYRLHKNELITNLENESGHLHFAVIYTTQNIEITYKEVELKIVACLTTLARIIASESGKGIL